MSKRMHSRDLKKFSIRKLVIGMVVVLASTICMTFSGNAQAAEVHSSEVKVVNVQKSSKLSVEKSDTSLISLAILALSLLSLSVDRKKED